MEPQILNVCDCKNKACSADYSNLKIVSNNAEVLNNLQQKCGPDSAVLVKNKQSKQVYLKATEIDNISFETFPVTVYSKLIKTQCECSSDVQTLKGFVGENFKATNDLKDQIDDVISLMDNSFDVTSLYKYTIPITTDEPQKWHVQLCDGDHYIYQTILVYAFRTKKGNALLTSFKNLNSGITYYDSGIFTYFFAPVYRNDCNTLSRDACWKPADYSKLIGTLIQPGGYLENLCCSHGVTTPTNFGITATSVGGPYAFGTLKINDLVLHSNSRGLNTFAFSPNNLYDVKLNASDLFVDGKNTNSSQVFINRFNDLKQTVGSYIVVIAVDDTFTNMTPELLSFMSQNGISVQYRSSYVLIFKVIAAGQVQLLKNAQNVNQSSTSSTSITIKL
ncbi:hypothetical protein DICPUDRAFT_82094 [Dictyostelium purpureum]|uniref:Monalysin Pore-forming domain-containing protein n=1 Tax=Dictyostelium purpureum TaxID=5786 RepID=F0ZVH7_DICPU|nr:uncharacterized protein DICPUDRAFT_82094 [Dictyostelium purpureum]EGC32060.1 hypothetical protein DICPUDRAFT_82094 [Dictyostelium purpureum]|eukprot:XP_003291414.1 hypothetical protein DICPUDRAFT_82094 [Dictyostelium purpureum]